MKILVGLSGGVDSSTVAYLLKNAGHEVIGATMSIWDKNTPFLNSQTPKSGCFNSHEEDIEQVKKFCKNLNIKHYMVDCSKQYQKIVLSNFKKEYLEGRTPNPCVLCNSTIKFDALPIAAKESGIEFDKFATGHYVRLSNNENRWQIQTAVDIKKDQSYFLYRLTQEQLSKVMFPLGEYTKDEIRNIAKQAGLEVHDKKDSQDFYSGDINDILQAEPQKGNFVNTSGKVLGTHNGIWNFTIGQRKGLGIAAEHPLYVLGFNKEKNEVIVGFDEEAGQGSLQADNLNWLSIPPIPEPLEAFVKIRSAMTPTKAKIIPAEKNEIKIEFFEKQKAIAPGQSAVFYDNTGLLLGGGIIKESCIL